MDLKAYAEQSGKAYRTLYDKSRAYRVMSVLHMQNDQARDQWRNPADTPSQQTGPAPSLQGNATRPTRGYTPEVKALAVRLADEGRTNAEILTAIRSACDKAPDGSNLAKLLRSWRTVTG